MVKDGSAPHLLLVHQPAPALVLDHAGTVIAVNDGSLRLISPLRQNAAHVTESALIGKNIADISLFPLPGVSPVFWTWNDILAAAVDAGKVIDDAWQEDDRQTPRIGTVEAYQDSENFWDEEAERQAIIETYVYVPRYAGGTVEATAKDEPSEPSVIRARATIRWYPSQDNGSHLIVLHRTTLPYGTAPTSPAAVKAAQHNFQNLVITPPSSTTPTGQRSSSHTPYFGLDLSEPDTTDIASAIIPHIVATLDTDGKAIKLSRSWYLFSGMTEEQSLGDGWISAMHAEDVTEMTKAWANVVEHGLSHWTHQARYRRAVDGTYCWFLIRAEPHRDGSGKILRWYASMMDIHEWVVARLKADIRRQSIITLFAQTDVMLWGIDKSNQMYICEGRLKWDPNRVVKLMESALREQQASRDDSTENTVRNADQELVHTIQRVLKGRGFSPVVEHWEDDRYFRTRFVAEHVPPGIDASTTSEDVVQAALALTFDITEEKARSILLTENKQLIAKEKAALDASNLKSRFLANMSHEIRTPISGIIGLSEHLSDCGLNEEQLEFSNSIEESAKFLLTLVNDVLDFSKMESGHMDVESIPFSPLKIISDTLIPLRLQAKERGLALTFDCKLEPGAMFLGDPWRLRQILTNLIGNSLKFTQQGQIDLSVRSADLKDSTMVLHFAVHDTGMGITEEVLDGLFTPFSQADGSTARLYGGTGLGLAICKQLVELMGGQISLASTWGQGTTATCKIPFKVYPGSNDDLITTATPTGRLRSQNSETAVDPKTSHFQSSSTSTSNNPSTNPPNLTLKNHILLVEDNPINRKVISLALQKLGYIVTAVCDGQQALDYLCTSSPHPPPHALLMDCMMPNVDGYQATRRIRTDETLFSESVRRLPIIALTASAIKGDREKCFEAGFDDFLTKPAARDDLKRTLLRWLGGGRRGCG
ncbi:hypothetical protein LEMA_P047100.1 [Plenodomus lingam JN3]|uniref:Uncharacterized protein n=1 Tax=Leptosphaeria maculans (strain JN3 / isolate v23.1.3 / race Av1-4-5-6-7-8) TaxID=985895 RepID=E5R534_LEPMJ|nr:hypothetical protein LEMA_P047100.1 [Plenodomus lingam JN3]CBX92004.1 hypothetical protein LEMA_P047100.1 [Plenodomus lingam JN3]